MVFKHFIVMFVSKHKFGTRSPVKNEKMESVKSTAFGLHCIQALGSGYSYQEMGSSV